MISLLGAIVALVLWFVLTFAAPVGHGIVHLLLGGGVLLLIRWWGGRPTDGPAPRP